MSYYIQDAKYGCYVVPDADDKNASCEFFKRDDSDKAFAMCNYLNGGDGLTKRERFAMAAMQGIQASNFYNENQSAVDEKDVAAFAVRSADALLAELERKE